MKLLIAIFALLLLVNCSNSHSQTQTMPPARTVMIVPVDGGYNIYSVTGELLLEFMPQDSSDIETIESIYDTATDFHADPDHWRDEPVDSLNYFYQESQSPAQTSANDSPASDNLATF